MLIKLQVGGLQLTEKETPAEVLFLQILPKFLRAPYKKNILVTVSKKRTWEQSVRF